MESHAQISAIVSRIPSSRNRRTWNRFALILVLSGFLAFSGCLSTVSKNLSQSDESSPPNPSPSETPQAMAWSSTEFKGDAALRIRFHLSEDSQCVVEGALSSQTERYGPVQFFEWKSGDQSMMMGTFIGSDHHVHVAGALDTRTQESARGSFIVFVSGEFEVSKGDVEITLLAHDLSPAFVEDLGETLSIRFALSCDENLEKLELSGGHELVMFSSDSMQAGVGLSSWEPASHIAIRNRLDAAFSSPNVRFYAASEFGVGLLKLTHPKGEQSWPLQPSLFDRFPSYSFEGSSGAYAVELDWAGTDSEFGWEYVWGSLAGFHPLESLDQMEKSAGQQ